MQSSVSRVFILMGNISSGRFIVGPNSKDHPAVIGRILDSGDWPVYLLDLNLLDFSFWSVLQAKVQVMP
jgi:hypothetical protein